jgi:predicted permease
MRDRSPRDRPFWYLRRRSADARADVDEEFDGHLRRRIDDLRAQGMDADTARREALRRFGDLERTRAYCLDQDQRKELQMQRRLRLEDLRQDLRITVRSLLGSPALTLTIVLTVGLGIGATTAMFAAVDAILLRPLPYAAADRLVRIYTDSPPNRFPFSVADYVALDAGQTQFERVAGFATRSMAWTDGRTAERLRGRLVSWTYFDVVGIRPALGRDFTAADAKPGAPPALIVSHAFWRDRLGGREDALGRPVRLDAVDYTLAGVLPPAVGPLEQRQDFFVVAQWTTPPRKGPFFIWTLGRLRTDVSRDAAASELRAINTRMFPIWKSSYQDDKATWSFVDLKTLIVSDLGTMGGLALGAVVLVWLIACTNASSLLLARATNRRPELALRTALGASRSQVLRHLLVEAALLAAGAASIGVAIAWAGIRLFRTVGVDYSPRTHEIALAGPALLVLAGVTIVSLLLFGLIPALHASGRLAGETLRSARTSTAGVAARRIRGLLVGLQFAIATPLLVAAALLLATLVALARVDLGFDRTNLVTGGVQLPASQYREPAAIMAFWNELQTRVERIPGVTAVAFADGRPPDDVGNFNNFDLEQFPTAPGQSQPVTPWVAVTPEYFGVMGITRLEGRLFDTTDGLRDQIETIVVDRAWAKRFFPNESAIGKRLKEGGCTTCPWTTVVGVVTNVKYAGLQAADQGSVYSPMPGRGAQPLSDVERFRYVVARTAADPQITIGHVRRAVTDLDPTLPLANPATLNDLVDEALQLPRSLSLLVGAFAAVALALSIVGIYGVMAYYVQQHVRDIGIRLALGSGASQLFRFVVGHGMWTVVIGIGAGLLAAIVVTQWMSSLLFGVTPLDVPAFALVAVLMLAVAFVACSLPARRAVGIDPAHVLRSD